MRIAAIIPARYASTRFPGKPLYPILGQTMIERVYRRVSLVSSLDRIIVATDDDRIFQAVESFGGEAVMTRPDHPTGTDRLAEVAAGLEVDLIVNIQGDEPLIHPRMIEAAITPLMEDARIPMGTLKTAIDNWQEFQDPNVVKVVTDREGFALYFSRSPVPHCRDKGPLPEEAFKHIGLYVYRRDFLLKFAALPPTRLESLEKLEQLRVLEHGYRIRVVETDLISIGVDVPEDIARVESRLRAESS
jgi:3-deoxy-manno-octulosonate cytidylyltransferase (CMP-KDO synthetase)